MKNSLHFRVVGMLENKKRKNSILKQNNKRRKINKIHQIKFFFVQVY